MIIFANPWYLAGLILIPLFYLWQRKVGQKNEGSIRISSATLISKNMKRLGRNRIRILTFLQYLTITLVIMGLSRPRLRDSLTETNVDVVDIVLVIDISSSMLATDFPPNRLEAVKKTAKAFIGARSGDRIGVLVFAGESFIQCPLTVDQDVLISLMDEVNVAEQSYDGTAIGMAIANATNRLRHSDAKSKVMILLSDGSNNAGELDPLTSADLASNFGIKIYTIGAGTNQDVSFIPGRGYIRNEIDEETLRSIADRTNGQYFRATNVSGLEQVYATIDELERTEIEIKEYTQYKELFGWFLIPALIFGLGGQTMDRTIFRRRI
ncbi:MAG: VWA domain-containing protein [Candidatus Marinimicrobia bacterium]|jgi:Ca-activated chloride channel family protein|nr:VWA domain-containing protein [Candidatus Neomarinimicrobiota bacterium]MBT3677072.1 VWA domain-containing protein [Candidatus Neomarinimicrobiota bacterium]MBT3762373.1 VWA domain-containing protein [Candidatus Neomarinimicrobiota bacterium]MBT4069481.1 VWA domain-containing protein [Candidatus Neomarinimicrobiota bacterium]MBT4809985.1 VWA domain-containing protein [Candidatus Neomarinimicrobiota bacterium]